MAPDLPPGRRWGAVALSRRGLLLAAAGGLAAGVAGPGLPGGLARPAWADSKEDAAYQEAFWAAIGKDKDIRFFSERGREYLYRPGQLLAAPQDLDRVREWLRKSGYPVEEGKRFGGVARLHLPLDSDIPAIVAKLRDRSSWPDGRAPAVQPHHVLTGFGAIMGNPQGPPKRATALPYPGTRLGDGAGVTVGICDTGIWQEAANSHPLWLGGHYLPEADDEDGLYLSGDLLAPQGGHGTFVAGVLRQAAPGVNFDPEAALNRNGLGDEQSLVEALGRLGQVQIINLSLGFFTDGDVPPMPVANALAARPDTVVVAAAGNSHGDRPAWPAALPGVIGVAALTSGGEKKAPIAAPYSNYGKWVNACAYGERVSTYVKGRLQLPARPPVSFPGFARWDGTSFAAPWVAGWLATRMTTDGITAVEAQQTLLSLPQWDSRYGVFVE